MLEFKLKNTEAILAITVGLIVLFSIYKINYFLVAAIVIGLIGLLSPFLSKYIAKIWYKLSEILALIVPKIVLGIVFYLFLFPIALLSRIGKKDNLMLSKKYDSYFVNKDKKMDHKDFERIW